MQITACANKWLPAVLAEGDQGALNSIAAWLNKPCTTETLYANIFMYLIDTTDLKLKKIFLILWYSKVNFVVTILIQLDVYVLSK